MRLSWERMKNLESKLREGMTANGLTAATQENSIQTSARLHCMAFQNPTLKFRADRLRIGVLKGQISRRVYVRVSEQTADGLLHAAVLARTRNGRV